MKVDSAEAETAPVAAIDAAAVPPEVDRLKTERDLLFDRLARLQADFDNYRKREARERAEFRDYAVINTVEQFLPVLDNFQLALKSNGSAEQLRTGVELIVKTDGRGAALGQRAAVQTVETQFDPRVHEAIEMVERNDLPDHQVIRGSPPRL